MRISPASGVPVGAFLLNEKAGSSSLAAGDHGTTYGGNPLACAAVCKVFELFEKNHILENVKEVSAQVLSVICALTLSRSFKSANLIFPIKGSKASL